MMEIIAILIIILGIIIWFISGALIFALENVKGFKMNLLRVGITILYFSSFVIICWGFVLLAKL